MSGDDPKRPFGQGSEKLELAERPSRDRYVEPAPYRPVPPPSAPKWPWVLLLLIGGAVAAWRVPKIHDTVLRWGVLPTRAPRPIVITSEPSGATIKIDGTVVGETPWAGDNHWHGWPEYEISKEGYGVIKGTFEGEQEQTLDITLKRR